MTSSLPQPVTFAVEAQKVRSYLLNLHHPVGGAKARFFIGWGFAPDESAIFTAALLAHASPDKLSGVVHFQWGVKYLFEGPLGSPRGSTPPVRSVWTVRPGRTIGLLSSAYPI